MPSKTKTSTRVTSYTKNLAKSFGYALGDVFKEYNPVIFNMSKEVAESSKELYQGIKSFAFEKSSASEGLLGDAKGFVDSAWKNALDDIKSGKWYNKERAEAMESDIAKSLGFDFDFDFDFDEDWGDDLDSTDSAIMTAETESTKQVVGAMDVVGSAVANSVNRATAESANYIVASSNRASKALYDLNVKGFSNVTNAIIAVNNTLGSIGKLGEPLTAHMQNSTIFFTNTTAKLDSIHQTLEKIAANTEKVPVSSSKSSRSRIGIDDLFSDDGLDFNTMKEMVKESFKDYKDLGNMALNAVKSLKGSKNVSVMQFATTMMTKALIPNMFKKSMEEFNKSLNDQLKSAFVIGRNRLHGKGGKRGGNGSIIELLLSMVIPDSKFTTKLNHGNYEKGAVAWDGISRKALTEVIPDTLLAIYSAVSGAPMMTYDYNKGTYVTHKSVLDEYNRTKKSHIIDAGGDFRQDVLDNVKSHRYRFHKASANTVFHYVDKFFEQAFMNGTNDYYTPDIIKREYKTLLGVENKEDEEAARIAATIIANTLRKNKSYQRSFAHKNESARERYGVYNNNIGNNSNAHVLQNGFEKGTLGTADFYKITTGKLDTVINLLERIDANTYAGLGSKARKGLSRKPIQKSGSSSGGEKSGPFVAETTQYDEIDSYVGGGVKREQAALNGDEYKEDDKVDKLSEAGKSMAKKLKDFFFTKDKDGDWGIVKLYKDPLSHVSKFFDKLSNSIDKVLFGEKKGDKDSLANKLKEKFTKVFDPIMNWLGGFWMDTKASLGLAGRWVGNHLIGEKRMAALGYGEVAPGVADNGNNSRGRRVTRTGIAAVSEGELIIPADLNPYYNGKSNRRQQARDEARARRKFFGSFAPGDKSVGQEPDNSIDNSVLGYLLRFLTAAKNGAVDKYTEFKNKASGKFNESNAISDKMKAVTNALFKELGVKRGAAGAGAIIGAGASLFTGGLIGPIFGASLGAAAGLVVNSNTIQNVLFGKTINKETGEVEGGLLSKEVANFMKNQVPGMAKGGLLGATAGLFMGSPLLGAMVGASVSYAKNSEGFKKYLFGDIEYDEKGNVTGRSGALISKKMQEQVKRAVPNIGIGALAGLVTGPFGVVGNVLVGSALGIATTSESFRAKMFGGKWTDSKGKEHQEDGLINKLSNNLLKNVNGVFRNIYNSLKGWSAKFLTNTTRFAKEQIVKLASKSRIAKAIKGVGGAIGSGIMNLTGGVIDISGGVFKGVNSAWSRHNLKRGYDVYDPTLGRNLTAKERAAKRGTGRWKDYLTQLGDMTDTAEIQNLIEELKSARFDSAKAAEVMDKYNLKKKDISTALQNAKGQLKYIDTNGDKDKQDKQLSVTKKIENWVNKIYDILHTKSNSSFDENGNQTGFIMRDARDKDATYIQTDDGIVKTDVEESTGKIKYDITDSETKTTLALRDEKRNNLSLIAKNTTGLAGISGLLTSFGEKLFGKKDDKKSFFDKIKDLFMGDDGLLGTFFNWLGGTKVGKLGSRLLSKVKPFTELLKGSWAPILGAVLFGEAVSGNFDGFFSGLGWGKGNTSNDGKHHFGNTYNYYNEDGELIDPEKATPEELAHATVRRGDKDSFSTSLVKNAVRGTVFGTGSVAGLVGRSLSNSRIGQSVINKIGTKGLGANIKNYYSSIIKARNFENEWNMIKSGKFLGKSAYGEGDDIFKARIDIFVEGQANKNLLATQMDDIFKKFTNVLKKIPLLKNVDLDNMAAKLSEKAFDGIVKAAAKDVGVLLSKALLITQIAFIIVDFTTGYEDAATSLKLKNPTTGERIICGLLRAIKNFVPFIGSLIPDSVLIDIFVNFVGPALGVDLSDFNKRREEAEAELNEYNTANKDNMSWSEYNKSIRQDYTWTERIGNATKTTWDQTKSKFDNLRNGIKEKGLEGYTKSVLKNMTSQFIEGYKEDGGGLAGIFSGIGNTFGSMLPGIFGEITKANSDINSKAIKGQLKEMWSITIPSFDGGKIDPKTGVETAVPGIFSKIIGQLPLLANKLTMTPIALVSALGNKVKSNIIDPIVNKIKDITNIVSEEEAAGESVFNNNDTNILDLLKINDPDPENPMGGFEKAIRIGSRIASVPIALTKIIGNKINGKITPYIDAIKNDFGLIKDSLKDKIDALKDGDVVKLLLTNKFNDKNPISGIFNMVQATAGFGLIIPTLLSGIGHKLFDSVKNQFNGVKENADTLSRTIESMEALTHSENAGLSTLGSLFKTQLSLPSKSPLDDIFNFSFHVSRLFNAAGIIARSIGGNIKDFVSDKVEDVKEGVANKANLIYKGAQWVKNKLTGGETSGSGSFINQMDSRYNGLTLGGKSFAANGCGPAAAVMSSGGNINTATNLAQYYQTPSGTDATFFADYARRNGKNASYAVGPNNVARSIYGGSGTILLGQDPTNRSKSTSPFGPNSHYVSVDRVTRNGGLVISDPEQRGRKTYSRNAAKRIIGSSRLAIKMSGSGTTLDDYNYQLNTGGSYTTTSKATVQQIALSDLRSFSPVTAEQMNQWIASKRSDSPFVGHGDIFIEASKQSGLDPRYILAHAAVESAWGTSNIAKTKHNYFGIAAFDSNTSAAYTMGSGLDGIIAGAKWIAEHYYNRGQRSVYRMRYNGGTHQYCTSDSWVNSIALIMKNGPENTKIKVIDKEDPSINAFTGGTITPTGTINAGSSGTSSSSGGSDDPITSAYKSGGILGGIQAVISNAFGKAFGGASDSSSSAVNSSSTNSSTGEVGEFDPNGFSWSGSSPVDIMKSVAGKLSYSQSQRDPEKGSSDCSSTVQWAIKKAGGPDIGGYTGAQYNDSDLSTVWYNNGSYATSLPSNIKPNDVMFFSRNRAGRPDGVGHVELYAGDGKMIGHGGPGAGPTLKNATTNKLIKVSRVIGLPEDNSSRPAMDYSSGQFAAGSGSGLVSYSDYVSRRSGGSSGVLLGSRVGSSVYGSNPTGIYVPKKRTRKFIGESGRKVYKNNRVDYQAMAAMSGGASGVMDNEAVITLLKGIYEYMASINENTGEAGWMRSSIDGTTNALSKTANGIRGMAAASSAAINSNNGPGKFGEVDDSVKELAKKMRSITA